MTHALTARRRGNVPTRPFPLLDLAFEDAKPDPPVTLEQAKDFMRVDGTDQDAVITAMIASATTWAENYTRRTFLFRKLRARFGDLPTGDCGIILPKPPVDSLTQVTFTGPDGEPGVIEVADLTLDPLYGIVRPNAGTHWPTVRDVDFRFVAGYGGAAEDLPDDIIQAILIGTAQMYEYRIDQTLGAQISRPHEKASRALLDNYRIFET